MDRWWHVSSREARNLIPLGVHALLVGDVVTSLDRPCSSITIVPTNRTASEQAGTGAHGCARSRSTKRRADSAAGRRPESGAGNSSGCGAILRRLLRGNPNLLLGVVAAERFFADEKIERFTGRRHHGDTGATGHPGTTLEHNQDRDPTGLRSHDGSSSILDLVGWRWWSRCGPGSRSRRNCFPTAGTLWNIRIIARRAIAIVPSWRQVLRLRRRGSGNLHNYRRRVGVGIRIYRRRIPVPCRTYDPPPTKPSPVPSVKPAPAAPNDDVVLMKMIDSAVPNRSRPRLTKSGQRNRHQ